MEFGIFLTLQSPPMKPSAEIYRRGVEMVVRAEESGFRRAWLAEHHFSTYSYVSSPAVVLSHLAALTDTIRLGTAIVPVPLHNPLLVAEQMATVDVLSNGRVDVGLGKGYQRYQFERLGADKDQDIEHYKESIELICTALAGGPFTFSGTYYDIPETVILPQPVQQPPPTWLVVNTKVPESVEFALQTNSNLFTGVLEPFSELTNIHASYPELSRRPGTLRIGTQRPVYVSYDRDKVVQAVEEIRWNARVSLSQRHDFGSIVAGRAVAEPFPEEPTTERILDEHVVFGTPEECTRKLKLLEDKLGCNAFSASFSFGDLPHEEVMHSMELFAKEVMPDFADSEGRPATTQQRAGRFTG